MNPEPEGFRCLTSPCRHGFGLKFRDRKYLSCKFLIPDAIARKGSPESYSPYGLALTVHYATKLRTFWPAKASWCTSSLRQCACQRNKRSNTAEDRNPALPSGPESMGIMVYSSL